MLVLYKLYFYEIISLFSKYVFSDDLFQISLFSHGKIINCLNKVKQSKKKSKTKLFYATGCKRKNFYP